jgi:hypothetical protein
MMEVVFTAIFIFIAAIIFALWEIEIEGKNGWAGKLPTWYKKSGFSKVFSNLAAKRPLSGYHMMMLLFMLFIFHSAFFFGVPWSPINEMDVLIAMLLFLLIEDFLWFEFNPYYGLKKFKKEKIWWHGKGKWFFDLFPLEYLRGIFFLIVLIVVSALAFGNKEFLDNYLIIIGASIILIILSVPIVKPYHSWYKKMRKLDESRAFDRKIKFDENY